MPCSYPCATCDVITTNCTGCDSSNTSFYHNQTDFNCSWCYRAIPFCSTCTSDGLTCHTCNSTLHFVNSLGQCEACSGTCKECTNTTQCISCLDSSHTMDPVTKNCIPCRDPMPYCTTCLSHKVCLSCDATQPHILTYPPSKFPINSAACVTCQYAHPKCIDCIHSIAFGPECIKCQPKYYVDLKQCFDCPLSCATCTTFSKCQTCINSSYALDSTSMCQLCSSFIGNCSTCSSNTTCVKCTNHTVLNPNPLLGTFCYNSGCMVCPDLLYPDSPSQLCKSCVAPCKKCLNADDCIDCKPFYSYVDRTKRCLDVCGDSIVMNDECDNGFGVKNDGCSDSCKQDINYVCVNKSDTVDGHAVKVSTCSYNKSLEI